MKHTRIYLFLIIGVVGLAVIYFFLRDTTSPSLIKVYKSTPVPTRTEVSPPTSVSEASHSHSHPHAEEEPSEVMLRFYREAAGEKGSPKFHRWMAYLDSKEGRAFINSLPSLEDILEKSKSFGFFQNYPERQAFTDSIYREHFPTGTVDENEHIIRKLMAEAILEHSLYTEDRPHTPRSREIMTALSKEDPVHAWLEKKFGPDGIPMTKWVFSTFEEIRLVEQEKYLAAENNETPARINDSTGSERSPSEIELPPGDGQTHANTRDFSEDVLNVEDLLSDDANTQQAGIERTTPLTLTPTSPESPELPTNKSLKTALRKQFSPERFHRALQTLNRYGPEEGLRRLKDTDPEVAKQVEQLLPKTQGED